VSVDLTGLSLRLTYEYDPLEGDSPQLVMGSTCEIDGDLYDVTLGIPVIVSSPTEDGMIHVVKTYPIIEAVQR